MPLKDLLDRGRSAGGDDPHAPHRPTTGPEAAAFHDRVKAEALRRILQAGLYGAGLGAGTGLLTGLFGRREIPQAEPPDVDLPYPQLKAGNYAGYYLGATPAVSAAVHGAAGAIRADDPLAGAAYGGAQGLGTGLGAGGGAMAGAHGASQLAEHLSRKGRVVGGNLSTAARLVAQLLGGGAGFVAGGAAGGRATDLALRHTAGAPPWKEKKGDWADSAVKSLAPTPVDAPAPGVFSSRWFRGDTHGSPTTVPWALPAALGAAGGGVYGGHALTRFLLKRRRKAELDQELAAAKKEYEDAMFAQYDPARIRKLAAANPAERLDNAVAAFAKAAGQVNEALGTGTGAYLALAALLAGGTGAASYGFFQSRTKSKMLADALKQRAMLRGLSSPADVYIHPVPAHVRHRGGRDVVEEDEPTDPVESPPV